jgi:putative ABC transport system substrate-binding protein
MRRRAFICLSLVAIPFTARAQQAPKLARIGVLVPASPLYFKTRFKAFQDGLAELGYVEGRNVRFEFRYGEGSPERMRDMARELASANVDLIFTASGRAVLAAKEASSSVPIVFGTVEDPLASGIVDSLARPLGNATGLSALAPGLSGKRVELLKEAVAHLSRIAFLWSPLTRGAEVNLKEARTAAGALRLELQPHQVRRREDFDRIFEALLKDRAEAIVTTPDPVINSQGALIVDFASKHRLAAIYAAPEFMEVGGLMTYAPSYREMWRRAASFADKILRGAKPSDLPVELPTKLELIVNLRTARALGINVSKTILVRADQVIE